MRARPSNHYIAAVLCQGYDRTKYSSKGAPASMEPMSYTAHILYTCILNHTAMFHTRESCGLQGSLMFLMYKRKTTVLEKCIIGRMAPILCHLRTAGCIASWRLVQWHVSKSSIMVQWHVSTLSGSATHSPSVFIFTVSHKVTISICIFI